MYKLGAVKTCLTFLIARPRVSQLQPISGFLGCILFRENAVWNLNAHSLATLIEEN